MDRSLGHGLCQLRGADLLARDRRRFEWAAMEPYFHGGRRREDGDKLAVLEIVLSIVGHGEKVSVSAENAVLRERGARLASRIGRLSIARNGVAM